MPGLKPNGKCLYYKSAPTNIEESYLCCGDEFHEPCSDFETCKKRQKAVEERKKKKEDLEEVKQDT